MKKFFEVFIDVIQTRTFWSGIASLISLVIYFKTGDFMGQIGVDDPAVINAVNQVSFWIAVFANLGIPYFRLKATEKHVTTVKSAVEDLDRVLNLNDVPIDMNVADAISSNVKSAKDKLMTVSKP